MQITSITATASRKFNHPHEAYSNFGFTIQMTADLCQHDIVEGRAEELSAMVEAHAETHKQQILRDLETERTAEILRYEIRRLEAAPATIESLTAAIAKERKKGADADVYEISRYERDIRYLNGWEEKLESERSKLAVLPRPKLIVRAEIHPGHPDHPATDANNH